MRTVSRGDTSGRPFVESESHSEADAGEAIGYAVGGLVTVEYEGDVQSFALGTDENMWIGRPTSVHKPAIPLDDPRRHIGRKHASLHYENGRYRIRDNGSINGTFLGEDRLQPFVMVDIRSGSIVVVEGRRLEFTLDFRDGE